MKKYKIQIPYYLDNVILPESLLYSEEQDAVDALIKALTQENIDFSLMPTEDRKVFINFEKGELAAVVLTR